MTQLCHKEIQGGDFMKLLNNTQRFLIATYATLTLLILIFTVLYSIESPAQYLKFGVRVSMFLTVVFIYKNYREQKILVFAFLCTLISDYFFILLRVTDPDFPNRDLYGMLGFVIAYFFLIAAFQRNFSFGKREMITLIPFVMIFSLVLVVLEKYAVGFMFWTAVCLGGILCYTGMTMVSSLYRGYFSRAIAWRIAIAGCILFLSDMVVAFSIFHPDYKEFLLWKESFIWGTYMVGWSLVLSISVEDHFVKDQSERVLLRFRL
jgi:hypothetical protein